MSTILTTDHLELYIDPAQDALSNGQDAVNAFDYSGNGRTLVAASPYPVTSTGAINGKPVIIWNGTAKPLANASTFTLACGFVVVKINEATFSNFSGILTDSAVFGILVGDNGLTNLYDFGYTGFEYRVDDLRSLAPFPAPMNAYKLIYFRFTTPFSIVGVQFGQDRADTARRAKMSLAFAALYSDAAPFESPTALRNAQEVIAGHFDLTLEASNPLNDFNYTSIHRNRYKENPKDYAKTTRTHEYEDGGISFNETSESAPQTWELSYWLTVEQAEIFDAHFDAHRLSRPFDFISKRGLVSNVFYKDYDRDHNGNQPKIQLRKIVLVKYPSFSSNTVLTDDGEILYEG